MAAALSMLPAPGLGHEARHRDPALVDREIRHRHGAPTLFASELEDPGTLGVGAVGGDIPLQLPQVQALSSHLQAHAAGLGVARVLPVVARDDEEVIDLLRRGIVDLVSGSSMSAMDYVREAGASVLLLERRDGESNCASVLLAPASTPSTRVGDLRGKSIALANSGAMTSFQLPLLLLREAGLVVDEIDYASPAPPAGGAGYYFVRSPAAVLELLVSGEADAGAVGAAEWRRALGSDPSLASGIRVLAESQPVPCALTVAGPAIPADRREALRRQLLAMSDDKAGRDVLRTYGGIDNFEPVDDSTRQRLADLSASWASLVAETGR